MIYFHGNAEDLGGTQQKVRQMSQYININVLAIEYPGYGLYIDNGTATEQKIKEDAEYVYKFVLQDCGLKEEDIVIFGRSMGSGPAAFIAGTFNPGALCLMSAYTSIRSVAGDVVGLLRFLVAERFNNLEMIEATTCPTFILHGSVDEVIPVHHGQ